MGYHGYKYQRDNTVDNSLDTVEGGYYPYVVADQDNLIEERDEDNNQQTRSGEFTVGNAETACAS